MQQQSPILSDPYHIRGTTQTFVWKYKVDSLEKYINKNQSRGTLEMAEWVKYLLNKREDLSSDP